MTSLTASTAWGAKALRPRLVWMMTPVALMTLRSDGSARLSSPNTAWATMSSRSTFSIVPARMPARTLSMEARTLSAATLCGTLWASMATCGSFKISSTWGS